MTTPPSTSPESFDVGSLWDASLGRLIREWADWENRARRAGSRRREAREAREAADAAWQEASAASPGAEPLAAMADHLVHAAWEAVARRLSTRHQFHPSLDSVRRHQMPLFVQRLNSNPLSPTVLFPSDITHPQHIPGFADVLTAQFADTVLGESAARVQSVAADPRILAETRTSQDSSPTLVLQHAATGLRARFTVRRSDGKGIVFSKSHDIPAVAPSPSPEYFVGLGIGERLYTEAAQHLPHVRWTAATTTKQARGLRRKLHARDPYIWAGECAWCVQKGIDWTTATQGAFADHPRAVKGGRCKCRRPLLTYFLSEQHEVGGSSK